jgi:hypothetical protein
MNVLRDRDGTPLRSGNLGGIAEIVTPDDEAIHTIWTRLRQGSHPPARRPSSHQDGLPRPEAPPS